LQRRAIAIREKVLGPNHPGVALGLSNLALLLSNQGENAKAVQLGRKSLDIYDKTLGNYSQHYTTALDNLATFSIRIGDYETATSMLQRSLAIQSASLIRELPLIPDQFRSSKLRQQGRSWEVIFGLIHSYPKASKPALEARLNRQGLLPEIERSQSILLNSANIDRVKLAKLKKLTQNFASVSLSADERIEIRVQREELLRDLYRQIPELEIKSVTTEQVANALPSNSVLIEFQRYEPYKLSRTKIQFSEDSQYIALVLRPDGSIKALPLGSAQAIDATIHQGLSASAEQQTDAQEIWTELSSKVLGPLLPYIGESDQWFLSPDSELNRVPFAALPAPQQPMVPIGEAVQIRLLTTGRELLSLQHDTPQGGPALVVANPSYDRKDSNRPRATIAKPAQQRSAELESNTWRPLPATETEGREVAALLSTNMISGAAATTASLQNTLGPRILHVATHGFFVSDQEGNPTDPLRFIQDEISLLKEFRQEDPLLRSGLVLAGANQPDIDPKDDGYLTAAEAVSLNLKGTELVVLSACSTGQGTIRTGEGVYGLQRSLTVAGARSTLLSLWKVDDEATAEFMHRYYRRLKDGEGRSEALAAVQKEFRNSPIAAWRHPYYWAAWQLLGDWRPIKGL
jgi:CHAT domain-containing protein